MKCTRSRRTIGRIPETQLAKKCGFEVRELLRIEGRPEYLRFSAPSYYFGMAWERVVNRLEFLSGIRVLLVAVLQKPSKVQANS
jgi:hypothetical protein